MNYMNVMYLANTAIADIRIFEFPAEDITSDYGLLLRLVNTFTIVTGEYYPMCYEVHDANTSKSFVYQGLSSNNFRHPSKSRKRDERSFCRCSLILRLLTNCHMYIADWLV